MLETPSEPEELPVSLELERLLDLRHSIHTTAVAQPAGSGLFIGTFRGKKRGQGTDYDDLREYSTGDDVRHIDWRASARTHHLQTRLYREESEHRIQLYIDLRECMYTGSEQLKSVSAGLMAAKILWQAGGGGSRINTIVLSNDGLKTSGTLAGVQAAIDGCSLLASEFSRIKSQIEARQQDHPTVRAIPASTQNDPQTNSYPDFAPPIPYPLSPFDNHTANILTTLDRAIQWHMEQPLRHTTNLWLSGMDFPGEHFNQYLKLLSPDQATVFVAIEDPIESNAIPTGRYHYYSEHLKHQSTTLGVKLRAKLEQSLTHKKKQLAQGFSKAGLPFISASRGDYDVIEALRFLGHLP